MFKIHSGGVPDCISQLFMTNNYGDDDNTRANKHLHKCKGKCEAIYRTFPYQGIYIWNLVLTDINIDISFLTFKKRSNYFYSITTWS